ncbi:hypothetical protein P692DRAFT_201802540 [Suillus brevipes Sb2]|nr:hypothetical protein P692DRAFT_201802540 [Suillus brevipes Sb2]
MSSISGLSTCAERVRRTKVVSLPRKPNNPVNFLDSYAWRWTLVRLYSTREYASPGIARHRYGVLDSHTTSCPPYGTVQAAKADAVTAGIRVERLTSCSDLATSNFSCGGCHRLHLRNSGQSNNIGKHDDSRLKRKVKDPCKTTKLHCLIDKATYWEIPGISRFKLEPPYVDPMTPVHHWTGLRCHMILGRLVYRAAL